MSDINENTWVITGEDRERFLHEFVEDVFSHKFPQQKLSSRVRLTSCPKADATWEMKFRVVDVDAYEDSISMVFDYPWGGPIQSLSALRGYILSQDWDVDIEASYLTTQEVEY